MRHSLKHQTGYLIVDHTASPGLTVADVAHVPGALAAPGGQVTEADLAKCNHCERAIRLHPLRIRARGYCGKCDHYLCDWCETLRVKTGVCTPMAQVLDAAQQHFTTYLGREDHPDAATPAVLLTDTFRE